MKKKEWQEEEEETRQNRQVWEQTGVGSGEKEEK
jgi:hypothetical protein